MTLEPTFSIIVVEDHPELEQAIRALLERAGYVVVCAADADGALELLRSAARPCIMLWDPLTAPVSLAVLNESALHGAPVATLPIGLAIGSVDGSPAVSKRITSTAAILSIVREHCPLGGQDTMSEIE